MFKCYGQKKNISIILVLILVFTVIPLSTFAQNNNALDTEERIDEKGSNNDNENSLQSASSAEKDVPESLGEPTASSRGTAISSGVYAIAKQNTTSYARCNTVSGGTYLSQQTFSSPPASETYRHAMFKIIYRSSTDDYVIRNMVNNEIVIYASVGHNSPLSIRMQNVNDSAVPTEKAWKITATSDGYYNISCTLAGITYYMYMPASGTLELTTNKNLSGAKWKFTQYTGATYRGWGQFGEWPEHIENGSSITIEAYIYSTVIGENRAWFRTTSVDSDIAKVTRLSYSAQMNITPKYGGNTKIRIA